MFKTLKHLIIRFLKLPPIDIFNKNRKNYFKWKPEKVWKAVIHSKVLAIVSLIAAIGAFWLQFKSLKEQRISTAEQFDIANKALLEQQVLGSWQLLTSKAIGNSGKIEAIEFLATQGIPLVEIDMSAKTHGGEVFLSGLDVSY